MAWHEKGTRYNIHQGSDGLLAGGAEGVQLTWMDAKVGDDVVTPRRGKPVEISALRYNALCALAELNHLLERVWTEPVKSSWQRLSGGGWHHDFKSPPNELNTWGSGVQNSILPATVLANTKDY